MENHIEPCYLLSYPRSGNHWARYIIEWFSGYPTSHEGAKLGTIQDPEHYDAPIYARCDMADLSGKPFIAYKRHLMYPSDDKQTPMLFILRPYEDAVVRHLVLSGTDNFDISNPAVCRELDYWADLLLEYHNWPARKELVYYTNLVGKPEISIGVILKFFGLSDEPRLHDFLQHLDYHRGNAFGTVAAKHGTSFNGQGWELGKHGSMLTVSQKNDWALYLSRRIGHIEVVLP